MPAVRSSTLKAVLEHGGDLDFVANRTTTTNKIERKGALRRAWIRIAGTVTLADDGEFAVALSEDGFRALLQQITLKENGKPIFQAAGASLYHYLTQVLKLAPELTQPGVTAAEHAVAMTLLVPLAVPDAANGEKFAIPTIGAAPKLALSLQWGGDTDVFSTFTDAIATWDLTVEVILEYDAAEKPRSWYWERRFVEQVVNLDAAASPVGGQEIRLAADFGLLRQAFLLIRDNSALDNDLVTHAMLKLTSNEYALERTSFAGLRAQQRDERGIAPGTGECNVSWDPGALMQGLPRLEGRDNPLLLLVHGGGTGVATAHVLTEEIALGPRK